MDNFVNYSKEIGFENTIDLILPCINRIVNFKNKIERRVGKRDNPLFAEFIEIR
jgi:hypothetical protein